MMSDQISQEKARMMKRQIASLKKKILRMKQVVLVDILNNDMVVIEIERGPLTTSLNMKIPSNRVVAGIRAALKKEGQ